MVGHVISASSFNDVQATPPPPSTYTVQPQDKDVPSIAQAYNLTPEELARANNISVDATLTPGQVLTLPANAVLSPPNEQLPSDQSLQQQTSAAVADYMNAVQQQKQAMQHTPRNIAISLSQDDEQTVDSKYQAMSTAIQNEIAGEIANRNNGVPTQFRAPTDQLQASFGQAIVQRYQSDPATQSAVSGCVNDGLLQSKSNALIAALPDSASPHDKLQSLGTQLQNQPQNVINYVFADPTVQGWIRDEASQVDQPYANVPSDHLDGSVDQATRSMAQLQTATQGLSPLLASAVIQASMPTIDKVAQLQINQQGGAVPFDTLQGVLAQLGNSDAANAVIQQTADAYVNHGRATLLLGPNHSPNGNSPNPLEESIQGSQAGNANFAIALGNALQQRGQTRLANAAFDAGAQGVRNFLTTDVSPLKAYEDAHGAAQQKDQKLSQLMIQSAALTPDQQKQFIAAYRNDPDNAEAYKADSDTANTLVAYMQNNQANLIFAAGHDPAAAQQLYGAMQDLTQSGQGEIALRFAGYINNDPAASKAFDQFPDYHTTFETNAVQSALGQLLVEKGGNTKDAVDQLLQLADPVFKGTSGWDKFKEGLKKMADDDTKISPFDVKSLADSYKEMGGFKKVWAMTAVTVDSLNGASAEQVNEMINSFSMASNDAAEIGSGALKVMADAGKFGGFNVDARAMSKLAARFAPGLGVIASTSALASDWKAVDENRDNPAAVAYGAAVFGDLVSVMGSFMEAIPFPPAQVAGMVADGIGVLTAAPAELLGHILGGTAESDKERQEFQDEQVKYLQACDATFHAGKITEADATAMAKDGNAINTFSQQLGLDPGSAQQILNADPEAFNQDTPHTQAVINMIRACQIQPGIAGGFLSALAKDNPNYADDFYNVVSSQTSTAPLTNSAILVHMLDQPGYANAKAYVQAHVPDVFSPDGYARRKADVDYETAQSSNDQQQQIGSYLKANQDAAYQAEMIGIMKGNGTLGTWVQQIAGVENEWQPVAASAIQNAQNASVLSPSEAQPYLAELGPG